MLTRDDLSEHCLRMTAALEDFPFGPEVAVYKVKGKMFALLPIAANPVSISLKCDPLEAPLLREMFAAVTPGYHLNKKHWNTVVCDGEIPDERLLEMIEDSYKLVCQTLKQSEQQALAQLELERE